MKRIVIIILVLSLFSACKSIPGKNESVHKDATLNTPEKYNDFIVSQSDNIGREIAKLSILVWTPKVENSDLNSSLVKLKSACKKSLRNISTLGDYEGNIELRDGMKELLTYYSKLTKKEFPTLIEYAKSDFYDSPDSVKVQEIFDFMDRSESEIVERLSTIQEAFAAKYNITLLEDEGPKDPFKQE